MNPIYRFDADCVIDATAAFAAPRTSRAAAISSTPASPGSVLVELDREDGLFPLRSGSPLSASAWSHATLLAAGPVAEVDHHPLAANATRIDRSGCTLIPGLVNAHTHLDLTHIGPQPYDAELGFGGWIDMIRRRRHADPAAIAHSVRLGAAMNLAGGVVAVGDIAGAVAARASNHAFEALRTTPLLGTSFLEFFAMGAKQEEGLSALAAAAAACTDFAEPASAPPRVRLGIQPHAPYSVSLPAYRAAADLAERLGAPLCTHLAESPDERQFITFGSGPLAALLKAVGVWDPSVEDAVGFGVSPVQHLADVLRRSPLACVHLNNLSKADIAILALASGAGCTAVYCPRASAYFGFEQAFGAHKYRDLLNSGVPVALGTDSIVNLPKGIGRLSTWDEMRFLRGRDGVAGADLLRMATVAGARAIGLPVGPFTFAQPGKPLAGVVAVEGRSLEGALASYAQPEVLVLGHLG